VAFWSASQDTVFAKRLTQAGFTVSIVGAKAHAHARREAHTIFVADRKKSMRPRIKAIDPRCSPP